MKTLNFALLMVAAGITGGLMMQPAVLGNTDLPTLQADVSADERTANGDDDDDARLHRIKNDSGVLGTVGEVDRTNPFFQNIGTNGRTCNTCHKEENGWGISRDTIRQLFDDTRGTDPIFRRVDGSNSPNARVSTVAARRAAYSMLLNRGVIRIGLPVPPNAEFSLLHVDDPYGFAYVNELSLFRRPPPVANLRFQATIMIDGRENFQHPGKTIREILEFQANSATTSHAEGRELTQQERQQIVDFQLQLFSAQIKDDDAGPLTGAGARGGPLPLIDAPFFIGINDPFGGNPTGQPFDTHVFRTFDAWERFSGAPRGRNAARGAVARGQALFNSRPIRMVGVSGITDDLGVPEFNGFCTTCHDTPNNGNHSVSGPVDLGLVTAARRLPDEPLYTFVNKQTGATLQTTDPGRGIITGQWKHLNRMKAPSLRSLAARPPYFHNGSAATLLDVVNFYDTRFSIGFTEAEKHDLVAFLKSL